MPGPKVRILQDILEEHAEEFAFLWQQRQGRLRSPNHTLPQLLDLEERIEAHAQGLLVAGEGLLPLVKPRLDADEALPVFLAAYPLLRQGTKVGCQMVLDAFLKAEGGKLDGLREALCYAGLPSLDPLQAALTSAPPLVAVSAAEILAFQNALDVDAADFDVFLRHDDAQVRRIAWRTASRVAIPIRAGTYSAGLADTDPHVQRETLWAAAWQAQPWLLDDCRRLARKPSPENWDTLLLLAILGQSTDVGLLRSVVEMKDLGPRRFLLAGAHGHPGWIDVLFATMDSPNLPDVLAAARSFTKITGVNLASDQRVLLPPDDGHEPDAFEKEFLDEARLPNLELAREHWKKEAARYRKGTRWCRGLDLSEWSAQQIDALDLESRWEASLRGRFGGKSKATVSDLERFPQTPTARGQRES